MLVLSPHPDDEAIGCGGAICWHVEQGDEVEVLFLTSGEKGGHGRDTVETAQLREQEARGAAQWLGYERLLFWRLADGELEASSDLSARLESHVRHERPALVYAPNAQEMHPDHRGACNHLRAAMMAIPLGERPLVMLYEVWTPLQQVDEIRDITAFVERKRAAIRAHVSQCEQMSFDEAMLGLNRYRGELLSWPEGEYAEVFELMKY